MKVKFFYDDESHALYWCPERLESLWKQLPFVFHAKFPENCCLQEKNSIIGNGPIIQDQEDFNEYIKAQKLLKNDERTLYIVRPEEAFGQVRYNGEPYNFVLQHQDHFDIKRQPSKDSAMNPKEKAIPETAKDEWLFGNDFTLQDQDHFDIKVQESKDNDVKPKKPGFPEAAKDQSLFGKNFIPQSQDYLNEGKKLKQNKDSVAKPKEKTIPKAKLESQDNVAQQSNIPLIVTHYYTSCNGCQVSTIVGVRYKCTVCPGFNYCEECEKKNDHLHSFVKMKQCDESDLFKYELKRKSVALKPSEWMKFDPNCDSLVQELFKVRNSSLKSNVQHGVEFNNDFAFEDDLKAAVELSNIVAEEDDDVDLGLIDQRIAALLEEFPLENVNNLYLFVSQAPKDLTIEELKGNWKLQNRTLFADWKHWKLDPNKNLFSSSSVNQDKKGDLAWLKKNV